MSTSETYILTGEAQGVLAVSASELAALELSVNDSLTPAELLVRSENLPVGEWWLRNLIAELCAYEQASIRVVWQTDDMRRESG